MGRRRGPVSRRVRRLCHSYLAGRISDEEFKNGIREIIEDYGRTGYVLQGIGLSIGRWLQGRNEREREMVWRLADEVDMKIRELFERWRDRMFAAA